MKTVLEDFLELVFERGRLREVSRVDSVAGWFCLSGMRGNEGVAYGSWAVALSRVRAAEFVAASFSTGLCNKL